METPKSAEVIVIDSAIFKEIIRKLNIIEGHVIRSAEIFKQVDQDMLQMTSREVMNTLKISESTLYRWRTNNLISYQYTDKGNVLFSYSQLYRAIYNGIVTGRQIEKKDLLAAMTAFKDEVIRKSIAGKL